MKVLCQCGVLLSFAFLVNANPAGRPGKLRAMELSRFKELVQDVYPKLSDEEVDKIVSKADTNGDGKIQEEEFGNYIRPPRELSDFKKDVQNAYPTLSEEEVEKVVKKADLNGDGKIQAKEFLEFENFIMHIPIKYFMTGARAYYTRAYQIAFPKLSDKEVDKVVKRLLVKLSLSSDRSAADSSQPGASDRTSWKEIIQRLYPEFSDKKVDELVKKTIAKISQRTIQTKADYIKACRRKFGPRSPLCQ